MNEQKVWENRIKLQDKLIPYLKAEQLYRDDVTLCPCCGKQAIVNYYHGEERPVWRCPSCNRTGDAVDYARYRYPQMDEGDAIRHIYRLLGLKITQLETVEAGALLDMRFQPRPQLVEGLLGSGLYLLAGASKIGKSWLVLHLADRVSKGLPLWERQTRQCQVLYVSLEDTLPRMQQRLNQVTGGEPGPVFIATEAELLGNGLEEQLTGFLEEHRQVGLVIIDTLQCIRQMGSEKYSYAGDYFVIRALKAIADRQGVTVLLVHHTRKDRKEQDEDAMDTINGTTGIGGAADGTLILKKTARLGTEATLQLISRDMPDLMLRLDFDRETRIWRCLGSVEDPELEERDELLEAVQALVKEKGEWSGTSSELLRELALEEEMSAVVLSRRLNVSSLLLRQRYGVEIRFHRSARLRNISLRLCADDANDANDAFPTPGENAS